MKIRKFYRKKIKKMIEIEKLSDRQFRSSTGCSKKEFDKLFANFIVAYNEAKIADYESNIDTRKRKPGGGSHGKLFDLELKLFGVFHKCQFHRYFLNFKMLIYKGKLQF